MESMAGANKKDIESPSSRDVSRQRQSLESFIVLLYFLVEPGWGYIRLVLCLFYYNYGKYSRGAIC